jgi:GNAT superfamily N-acetyltransferase
MNNITIQPAGPEQSAGIVALVGELLDEIMQRTGQASFDFDLTATETRASELLADGKYWALLALDDDLLQPVGVITLCESYALHAEGVFGTIPELYVRPEWRSQHVGAALLARAEAFARKRGWSRRSNARCPFPRPMALRSAAGVS